MGIAQATLGDPFDVAQRVGSSVSSGRDVNNDGYPDFVVDTPQWFLQGNATPRAYVWFGNDFSGIGFGSGR